MSYHVILDNQQNILIITHEELDIAIARGAKELYEGSKKECEKYYDNISEEWGYTGPIWDALEINYNL